MTSTPWNHCFFRSLKDWKVDIVEELFSWLQGKTVVGEEEDKVVWMNSSNNKFFVKLLCDGLELGERFNFPKSVVWNFWVPSKVSFSVWDASLGKVLIVDQLQRRGWTMVNRCFLCREEEESIDHILLYYSKVRILGDLLFALFGIQWVQLAIVKEALLG